MPEKESKNTSPGQQALKKMIMKTGTTLALLILLTQTATAALENGGFETGDLSGWTISGMAGGHVDVLTASDITPAITPPEGNYFALLSTGPGAISTAQGPDLDGNGWNERDISNLEQAFTLTPQDVPAVLSFEWSFLTSEVDAVPFTTDDLFQVTLNGVKILTGSVPSVSYSPYQNVPLDIAADYTVTGGSLTHSSRFNDGRSSFKTFSYEITDPGTYTLTFTLADNYLTGADSGLLIDNVTLITASGQQSNQPPVAYAGVDFTVEQTGPAGAEVTLNASGSSDPDGDTLTYNWSWPGGSATGVSPTVLLPPGTTPVTLVVNDGTQDSEPVVINVTVVDTTPPAIEIPGGIADLTVEQQSPEGAVVELNVSAVDLVDGEVNVTSDAPAVFPPGTITVTFTATDTSGNTATVQINVTVSDTTPPDVTAALVPVDICAELGICKCDEHDDNGIHLGNDKEDNHKDQGNHKSEDKEKIEHKSKDETRDGSKDEDESEDGSDSKDCEKSGDDNGIHRGNDEEDNHADNGNHKSEDKEKIEHKDKNKHHSKDKDEGEDRNCGDSGKDEDDGSKSCEDGSDDSEGWFRVEFQVFDAADPAPVVTAVLNGIEVTSGQIVRLELDDDYSVGEEDGFLEIEGPEIKLVVTATDSSGNTASAEAVPDLHRENEES